MSGRLSRTRAYSPSPKSREASAEEVATVIDKSSPRRSVDSHTQHSVTAAEDLRDSFQPPVAAEESEFLALESAARRRTVCAPPGPILVRSDHAENEDRPVELENL